MKNLFLTAVLLMTTDLFASQFINIKTLTNSALESATQEIARMDLITHVARKKITEFKGTGSTVKEIRQNAVAQAAHTLCPYFDDGVSVVLNSKDDKGTLRAVSDFIDSSNVSEGDAVYKALTRTVDSANKQIGVEVYSGAASGNNTAGTILGFFDTKTNEIAVFASTNCGSDN